MPEFLQSVSKPRFRFDNFELYPEQGFLLHEGHKIKLQRQPFRVLEYLLAQAPAVISRDELGNHIWGAGVHVDLDQSLNYCIRQVRQVLGDSATEPRYIETLPRQGYRFIGHLKEALPEVPAVYAPEKPATPLIDEESQAPFPMPPSTLLVDPAEPLHRSKLENLSRRRVVAICLGAAAILLISVGVAWHLHKTERSAPIRSIAVLPLDNLSDEPGHDYFAAGMTDELITMLAKSSTLEVKSRTSVMQYKGVHRPLREIARELEVDAVLEGSLVQRGNSVHVTLQLIKASSDAHLLAESYDRDIKDAAALPAEAAKAIANATHSSITQTQTTRFVLPEAHDAYLRGHYLWFGNVSAASGDPNEMAGEAFRRATKLQPDYAPAWSGLSTYYGAGAIIETLSPQDSLAPAEAAARRAVELDPALPEAHLALGSAIFINRWDWAQAQAEINRAIELDPKFAEAYHFRAKILASLDRHEEAIQAQRTATELDPFARPWALALSLLLAGRYDEALVDAQQRLEATPLDPVLYYVLADSYRCKGLLKDAVQMSEHEFSLKGKKDEAEAIRRVFASEGYPGVLHWRIASLKQRQHTHYVSPVELASLYAQLHLREETLTLLEEGLRQHSPGLLWMQDDPAFDFLRPDQRYLAILRKVGLPQTAH